MGQRMQEGWLNDNYLILFSDAELEDISQRYAITHLLPGYTIVGLWGWDDFIVQDPSGNTYTIPTLPLDKRYLKDFRLPEPVSLETDNRYQGKIKWYITPLIFGGDANDPKNLIWVSHEQHAQLVIWWNKQYRSARGSGG